MVFKRVFKGDLEVDMEWEIKGDSKGDLLSRSGKVKVWFRLQLKFNSLELDSDVGQLVSCSDPGHSSCSSQYILRQKPINILKSQ